jgi:hypothetical protein
MAVQAPAYLDAAMSSPALVRARSLAVWVGQGRTLTASGVLRPTEAVEACRELGIDLPGSRLRSAADVWELMRDWETAAAAGFIQIAGRRAQAMPELLGGAGAFLGADVVLAAWLQAAAAMLGLDDEPCAVCVTVLHHLQAAAEPVDMEKLVTAITAEFAPETPGSADNRPCPACGRVHDDFFDLPDFFGDGEEGEDDPAGHATELVVGMLDFGAVAADAGVVRLTELGVLLIELVLGKQTVAPDANAAAVTSAIAGLPPTVAVSLARPWLSARRAPDAARELITYAESAQGGERIAALAFAGELGTEAADAWRELAKRQGIGAYGRQWLAEHGDSFTADPADEAWLAVDALCLMIDTLGGTIPAYLIRAMMAEQIGDEAARAAELVSGSGHPRAADIAALLTGQQALISQPVPAGKSGGREHRTRSETSVYQLKITLRGVSKPPVWRRILVPGNITLRELHEIIQRVMGWGNCHLHVFTTEWQEYGSPDPELGHANDQKIRLDQVLTGQGDRLRYTYDFGDDWEHDIVAEQTLTPEPGQAYPRCTAGKGACPPEDCGGAWGYADLKEILADSSHDQHQDMLDWLGIESGTEFDPAEFSVTEADTRSRWTTRNI